MNSSAPETDLLSAIQHQLQSTTALAEVVIAPDWPLNHPGLSLEFTERQVMPFPGPWLRTRERLRCRLVGPSEIGAPEMLDAAERELLTALHSGIPALRDAGGQRTAEIIGLQWLSTTHAQPDGLLATRTVDFELVVIRRQIAASYARA